MNRKLSIYFTSDVHGYFSNMDYATGKPGASGLACCVQQFEKDGNTLIIDGGDMLQGSPLTYYLHKNPEQDKDLAARIMNCAGVQFVTLGNHDFNYGKAHLERYLKALDARCLCANVEGVQGVEKWAVVTLENGLRVGITGVVTHFVNIWERPENLVGITITPPMPHAREALAQLRAQNVDLTVCIYHGGFESDLDTGRLLSETEENQGYRMAKELAFDILLTGHQHMALAGRELFGSFVCQPQDKAKNFIRLVAEQTECGFAISSKLMSAGTKPDSAVLELMAETESQVSRWLDTPVGHLDAQLLPQDHITMAAEGSLIANFFNQVQLEASGADLSSTSLGNEVKGFNKDVTIRDIVATYIYPNTLQTLEVDRGILKEAMERSAEYFALDENGKLCVSRRFLEPKVEHYNYDFLSGAEITVDVTKPVGSRITSIRYQGEELAPDRKLTLCMNNYRSSGTGGYDCYTRCRLVKDQPTEIVEMIMDYVMNHGDIHVDRTQWLQVKV